jgi:hAT family C-terminal dimerisation region
LIFDQQVYLHPIFKDLKYLKSAVTFLYPNDSQADATRKMERVQAHIREKVLELAIFVSTTHVAGNEDGTQLPYPGAIPTGHPLDEFSSSMLHIIGEYADQNAMNVDPNPNAQSDDTFSSVYQAARKEMSNYATDYDNICLAKDPLAWWYTKRNTYPILSKCVRILYSVPASSGPLELDIGHTGMILTKQRSSLKGDIAEAATVINRNRDLVDLVNVDAQTAEQLNNNLPENLVIENSNAVLSLFGVLDIHFPRSMHHQTSEMMDAIALDEDEE